MCVYTKMPCKKCRQDGHNSRTCKVIVHVDTPADVIVPLLVSQVPAKRYYCYILGQCRYIRTGVGRTYNGYTVNLVHRLRQHNGEIKGGAFATRNVGPWEFIAVMTCIDWTSVRAMQVEWLIRYPTRKKPRPTEFSGAQGRINSLAEIVSRMDEPNIKLYVHPRLYEGVSLPERVELFRTIEHGF
jgi:predicted GIY-YIG superfamily endonuclease